MPRYFFHCVGRDRDADQAGSELPGEAAARLEAIAYAGEVLKANPQELWNVGQWRVEVTDAWGVLLFTVVTLAIDALKPARLATLSFNPSND